MTPVRPEPAVPGSRVKHSTTEPLRSLCPVVEEFHKYLQVWTCIIDAYFLQVRNKTETNVRKKLGFALYDTTILNTKFQPFKAYTDILKQEVMSRLIDPGHITSD